MPRKLLSQSHGRQILLAIWFQNFRFEGSVRIQANPFPNKQQPVQIQNVSVWIPILCVFKKNIYTYTYSIYIHRQTYITKLCHIVLLYRISIISYHILSTLDWTLKQIPWQAPKRRHSASTSFFDHTVQGLKSPQQKRGVWNTCTSRNKWRF